MVKEAMVKDAVIKEAVVKGSKGICSIHQG